MENINFRIFIRKIFETFKGLFEFSNKVVLFLWIFFVFYEIIVYGVFSHSFSLKVFNLYKSFFSIFSVITIFYIALNKVERKKNIFNLFLVSGGIFIGNIIVILALLLVTVFIYIFIYLTLTLTGSNNVGVYDFLRNHFVLSSILFLSFLTFYQYIIVYPIGKAFVEKTNFWNSFKIVIGILKPSNLKKLLFNKRYCLFMLKYGSFVFLLIVLVSILAVFLIHYTVLQKKIFFILLYFGLNQIFSFLINIFFSVFTIFSYFYVKDNLEDDKVLRKDNEKLEKEEKEEEKENDII